MQRVENLLRRALQPSRLVVKDVSHQHAGHHEAAREIGGTHMIVEVVSPLFEGKGRIERHRMIFGALEEELAGNLHMLQIKVAKTEAELG